MSLKLTIKMKKEINTELQKDVFREALLGTTRVGILDIVAIISKMLLFMGVVPGIIVGPVVLVYYLRPHIPDVYLNNIWIFVLVVCIFYLPFFYFFIFVSKKVNKIDSYTIYSKIFTLNKNDIEKEINSRVSRNLNTIATLKKGWKCTCPDCKHTHVNQTKIASLEAVNKQLSNLKF